jgi:hypothetical protein
MADKNYITFIDNSGRAIFGVNSSETDTTVKVENPVMITVQQQQQGQMAVQLFPLFFQEFVVEKDDTKRKNFFSWNKTSIAIGSDFEIEPKIVEQYERIVNPTLVAADQSAPQSNNDINNKEVINLFDEE